MNELNGLYINVGEIIISPHSSSQLNYDNVRSLQCITELSVIQHSNPINDECKWFSKSAYVYYLIYF
jgi:hypothetical protein